LAGRFGPRFGLEAAFLIAVAVILGLLEVTWPAIVAAMAIAWLVVAAVEVVLSRERARAAPEPAAEPAAEAAVEPSESFRIVPRGEEEELFITPAIEAVPAPEPAAVVPAVEVPPQEAELPPAAAAAEEKLAELEPEPVPIAAVEELPPPPPPPVLEAVPSEPEPVVAVPEAEPEPEPEPEPQVVELHPEAPREWNLWELERLVRDHAGDDPIRDEEWSYLLMYLREFASPDGHLSRDFDGLVRESFGEILRIAR
jgi:hypothetical protein